MKEPKPNLSSYTEEDCPYFDYGSKEIDYLCRRDKRLAAIIDKIGIIKRPVIPDLFAALVHSIVGQQISTKAHASIWHKIQNLLGVISAENVLDTNPEQLKSTGISYRKVEYIRGAAQVFIDKQHEIIRLPEMGNEQVVEFLTSIKGIGTWSAEMLLLFSLQRPDILSFGDLGILRGLRMVYHHRKIDRKLFERYRRRFSPYCSVASLYLWEVAAGAVEGMKDYATT